MAAKTDEEREQERQNVALRKYAENVKAEIARAIIKNLETHEGRALLWWLLEIGRIGTQPFAGIAARTDFNCGELNVGNQVLARIIEVSPDGYLTMMKEKANERNASTGPSSDSDSPSPRVITGAFDLGDD